MSKSLSIINTAADTFGDLVTKINNIIVLANTEVVTANSTGALTSGNGFVNGVFGSNTLVASVIQGGNVGTPGALTITANTMTLVNTLTIGNSTVNSVANSSEATITTVKATTINVGANVSVNTTFIKIGNSTANVTINSTSIDVDGSGTFTSVLTPQINVGANVSINVTTLFLGNSTTNVVANTSSLSLDGGLTVITGSSVALGNSTVNAVVNSIAATFGNSTVNSIAATFGNSTVNAVVNSTTVIVGGNASLNSTTLHIGNSSVNATVNSTVYSGTADNALYLGGVAAADYQLESGLADNVATLTANNSGYLGGVAAASYVQNTDSRTLSGNLAFSGANVVFSSAMKVGANVVATTSSITVGNSTVSSFINSTAIDVDGSGTFTSVLTPQINVGANVSINATTFALGNSTANVTINSTSIDVDGSGTFTSVLTPQINVGLNVSVNATVLSIGNSSVNAMMNSTVLTIDTINFQNAVINSVTISNAFTVNIGTFSSYMNVGANIQMNTSTLKIGNSSVNSTVNSTMFSGTADNALYLGGVAAADYQLESGLAANVATMAANNASYLGGVIAASYQLESGLAANVATLDANNASFLGGTAAASYVKNTDSRTLSGNLTFSGANSVFSSGVKVGANVVVTTSTIDVGNSSVNTRIGVNYIIVNDGSSSGGASTLNAIGLQIFDGLSIGSMNSTVLSVPTTTTSTIDMGFPSALINVGANVSLNTTIFKIGNSTVNSVMNNSTLAIPIGEYSTRVNVGSNVTLSVSSLDIGNGSINSFMNSSVIRTTGAITGATANLTTTISVGANVTLNLTSLMIGNSTVNTTANSSVVSTSLIAATNATVSQLNVSSSFTANSSEILVSNTSLVIDQRTSADAFIVRDQASDSSPFVIDAAGIIIKGANASLGTIWQGASAPYYQQIGINVPTSAMTILAFSETTSVHGSIWLGRSRGTAGTLTPVLSGDYLGSVKVFGASNTSELALASEIRTYADSNATDGLVPSTMRFYTSNTGLSEVMRIGPDGNVGIRNSSPSSATLSLGGTDGHAGSLWLGNSTANGTLSATGLSFGNSTVNAMMNTSTVSVTNVKAVDIRSADLSAYMSNGLFSISGLIAGAAAFEARNSYIKVGNSSVNGVMNSSTLTIGTVTETSDLSLKENVEYLGTMEALDIISALKGAKYNMKNDPRQTYGLIAQDVEQVIPEIVFDNGHKSLKYSAVIPILVEAIKELRAEVDRLKK